MDKFVYTCVLFTMFINAKKTVPLAQRPAILLNDTSLEVISKFCYLKSIVSSNLSLDKKIDIHIGRAGDHVREAQYKSMGQQTSYY